MVRREVIRFYGHREVRATHPRTIELTKEDFLTAKGDCIVGVSADRGLPDISEEFRRAIQAGAHIDLTIRAGDQSFRFRAAGDPRLPLSSEKDMVIRRSDYVCGRTLAVRSEAAAIDIPRKMVGSLRDEGTPCTLIMEVEEQLKYRSVANTMQALVKYHGLRDWKLRIPYHDSISVNTTVLVSEVVVTTGVSRGRLLVEGMRNLDAEKRLEPVLRRLADKTLEEAGIRLVSRNRPQLDAKGLGFSSSAGAALTLACHRALNGGDTPDYSDLSRVARLFAASASRSMVGGFSRLRAGDGDEDTYAEKIGDERDLDLRTLIVPLPSTVRTEDAHREVTSSPFFGARLKSATRRCDEMEKAIGGGDLRRVGELAEQDTLELHSITMTGSNRLLLMSPDTLRIIIRVRELRSEGTEAYYSMQTGPSVFINTSEKHEERVERAISKLGFKSLRSRVGDRARIIDAR